MASSSPTTQPRKIKLLLDQGFPKPSGFDIHAIDRTIEVVHLHDFDPALAKNSTPDWVLYCTAVTKGFDALVTRDQAQLHQPVEMFVLSCLRAFTVITWKKPIEDPVREWGQLLAYLPEVKKLLEGTAGNSRRPEAIMLPAPTLSAQNVVRASDGIGVYASKHKISHREVRDEALAEVRDWLAMMSRAPDEFDALLGLTGRA